MAEKGRKAFPFLSSPCRTQLLFCIFIPRATFVLATLDLREQALVSRHLTLPSLVATYGTLILLKGEGPVSPKTRKPFLSRKANFQIKTC